MIRHIFKIIWNERKVNVWIMLEYVIVFCVLWFCCDFLYYTGKSYFEYPGHDTKHTYLIRMGKKDIQTDEVEDRAGYEALFTERVKRFPGVESLAFSKCAIPYSFGNNANGYQPNQDSIWTVMWHKMVTPGFFDVYKIKLQSGRPLEDNDRILKNNLAIAPKRDGLIGEFGMPTFPVHDVTTLNQGKNKQYNVVGIYEKNKPTYLEPFDSMVYQLYSIGEIDLAHVDISIRVSPEEDHDFVDRFMVEMREQLFIGPYFLITIIPSKVIEKMNNDLYVTDNLNGVLAVTGFLFVNIFLALIGTFWLRTISRRSQIGLRIAMGSSKRKIKAMMYAEALIMLFLASILSIYICLNLAHIELLSSLGIPLAQRSNVDIGNEQDVINYLITFGFLAIISCLAIWYPASRASNIAPAEALRDE